jgi:hypothetical protein
MIRRASFLKWGGPTKDTTNYVHPNLSGSAKASGPDDPMAAALAVLKARDNGIDRFLGSSLVFASASERPLYRHALETGLAELEALLVGDGLL